MLIKLFSLGFMLFAFFFGGGNLIFPIKLGWESGEFFNPAIIGFLVTGVGIPFIGVIAAILHEGGIVKQLSNKIHPIFSFIFMIVIYLTIGPFFAIPRTATISFEIINHTFNKLNFYFQQNIFLLIFSIIYFIIVYFISKSQAKLVDIIGQILAPVLLLLIIILAIFAFFKLNHQVPIHNINYNKNNSLTLGILNGYQTMDALASVVFATIIFNYTKNFLIYNKINANKTIRYCFYSVCIACIGLILTYVSLGWIGNHFYINTHDLTVLEHNKQHIGTYILTTCAQLLLGLSGNIIITIIVIIACLTTAIGLVVATSNYFFNLTNNKFNNKIKYNHYVLFFTFISFILSNQGLNKVISTSIPILLILYPITLNILILFILDYFIKIPKPAYIFSIVINILINLFSHYISIELNKINFSNKFLSFFISKDFIWIVPTIIAFIIGFIYGKLKSN